MLFAVPVTPLLAQPDIPTPESVLGFPVGADFRLASYDESIDYFRQMDAASDRLQLIEIGRTSEGREWYVALISSAANLSDLERYRLIAQRLAHPTGLTDDEARQLARSGKAIVHIDGGLHASEVACAQHTIQLAYDLLVRANEPKIQAILDNVIFLLWPSINPDGQNMVVDWYRSNLGTPYEVAPMPWLYQKYIGHDNNRDAYMLNMIESRVVARFWRHWEPHIIHVHHQSSPFPTRIWLPPFAEPIAPQAPPLMSREVNMIGMAMAQDLESAGKVGATHMTPFDAWYPGYIDYLPMFQNIAAYWTETALYRYATPRFYRISDFPASARHLRPQTLYSSPWEGGWWRLGDAVDYMVTASMSVLDYAAKYREDLLYNRYQAGRNTIRKYEQQPPHAYFIEPEQRDPVSAIELLRRLAFNGVRVSRLTQPVSHEAMTYAEGTWVIPMNQEFAELVRQVFDAQVYPDLRQYPEGPPQQPYDAAGWTLPYQMDVRVHAAPSPLTEEVLAAMDPARATPVDWRTADEVFGGTSFDSPPGLGFDSDSVATAIIPAPGRISGSGSSLALDPAQNNTFRAINRAWQAGGTVRFEPGTPGKEGLPGTSGRYVIAGVSGSTLGQWVDDLALQAERTDRSSGPAVRSRIALYRPWRPSMDQGWSRWVLEQYGFQFSRVTNAEIRAGDLSERYDVVLLPAERPQTLLDGFSKGSVPPRYEGGIGAVGVRALDEFVRGGGTLVCLNQSSEFAIEQLHLPVQNAVAGLDRTEYFLSGSILEVTTDPSHPVMAGMSARAKVFVGWSPVFTILEGFQGAALAKYQENGSPLLSGYLLGERHLQGYAAALDVHHGDGHVILIGFRPQWRGQSFGSFKVLFNALLYGGELARRVHGTPEFWSAPEKEEEGAGGLGRAAR
ncbi:MAG: hypothetical protein JSW71_15365 [Gemmatimonadota bacterium]|nr:MAG: hypothetical protein JSW71_15365 [Gemmatimonadota bacterium]